MHDDRAPRWRCICGAILGTVVAMVPVRVSAQLDEAEVGKHIVTVRMYKGDAKEGDWAGVVVNDKGDVLTSAAVLSAGRRVKVIVRDGTEWEAEKLWKDTDVGVVRVEEGLEPAGLPVSVAALARGTRVVAVVPPDLDVESGEGVFVPGAVGEDEASHMRHNAMITARGYGSPVINECGQVAGLNVPDSTQAPGRLARDMEPRDTVLALGAEALAVRLRENGTEFELIEEECVSAEARAAAEQRQREEAEARAIAEQRQREEAEARAAAEQRQREEAEAQAAAEQRQREEAEARAAAEQRQREEAEAQAAEAERERRRAQESATVAEQAVVTAARREQEQRRSSEQLKRFATWGVAAATVLLLLLLLFWVLSARRKRHAIRMARTRAAAAEREAVEARRQAAAIPEPAPFDCVLTGRDAGGAVHALNLRRDVLGAPAGIVVGRDPSESSHIVVDASVSRAHARVYVKGGVVHIEDLGSTNGTFLNGQKLVKGEGARIRDGDELALGSVMFRIDLKARAR